MFLTSIAELSWILPCVLLCGALVYFACLQYLHPLAAFPGPFFACFSDAWKAYQVWTGHYEEVLLAVHRRYGKIVRIGPNHLDISDAAAVKGIYGAGRSFQKSAFYGAFTAIRPNMFGVRDEEIHAARRKAPAFGFSLQSVSQMEPFMDARLQQLIDRLDRAAADGEAIDLEKWIAFFVMDVLGELAFSKSFNVLNEGDESLMPPVQDHVLLATMSGQMPWTIPYINKIAPYIPVPALQKMIKGRTRLRQMAITSVNERLRNNDRSRKDLLGRMLEELDAGLDSKGRTLDIADIQTEAFGFIVAGSHTTAASTNFLLWHLLHSPAPLAAVRAEIDTALAATQQQQQQQRSPCIAYAALAPLPYLQAALTESLRISPVFTMPLMRRVPAGGRSLAGADVSICNFALHHDGAVFGGELDRFVPERWLDAAYGCAGQLMPFGAGHRACVGRNIALMEMLKVVGSLVARFDLQAVEGGGAAMPKRRSFGVAALDESLVVRVRRRRVENVG